MNLKFGILDNFERQQDELISKLLLFQLEE
jgi:hypothetical protein